MGTHFFAFCGNAKHFFLVPGFWIGSGADCLDLDIEMFMLEGGPSIRTSWFADSFSQAGFSFRSI